MLNEATGPDVRSDIMKQLIKEKLGGIEHQEGTENCNEPSQKSDTRFTQEEVEQAIKSLNPNKFPGIDLMDVRMVRSINRINNGLLLRLYNSCVGLGRFPKKWKEAEVVFFQKKGKDP